MKKILKIFFLIVGVLVLAAIVWLILWFYLFSGVHPYAPEPVYSADRSKVIIPTINFDKNVHDTYLLVHIEIQDTRSGEILFQVQTRASDRMHWSVAWINEYTVKLESSDIGSYCWAEKHDSWQASECP